MKFGILALIAEYDYEHAGAHRFILFPPTLAPDTYQRELEEIARTWM
jgi:hypothetical protein